MNYAIHEKETLAIISALDQWSQYLCNGINFTIVTNHESIKYLDTQLKLSRRQARWIETLSEYNYTIAYQPRKENIVADALSR